MHDDDLAEHLANMTVESESATTRRRLDDHTRGIADLTTTSFTAGIHAAEDHRTIERLRRQIRRLIPITAVAYAIALLDLAWLLITR